MKKRTWLCMLLSLGLACGLAACQKAPEGADRGQSGQSGENAGAESTGTESAGTAKETEAAKPDYSPLIAAGYQFVEDVGICEPENPVIYQMEQLTPLTLTNEYANARLTAAFYQDKSLVVKVTLEDHSVSLIPANEVEVLLEQERENEKKQERGEAAVQDNSYFCIDSERKIYGRSKFWDTLYGDSGGNRAPGIQSLIEAELLLPGITEGGYGFNTGRYSSEYREDEDGGDGWYGVVSAELQLKHVPFTKEELEGAFELKLEGFEQSFQFQFGRVKEVASLEELPGWTVVDDEISFLTAGEYRDGELKLSCYPYQKDGNRVGLVDTAVTYRTAQAGPEQKETIRFRADSQRLASEALTGIHPSGAYQAGIALPRLSDGDNVQDVNLILNQLSLTSYEQSDSYSIPIPETDGQELDEKVEFDAGTVYLTSVERIPGGVSTGQDEDGGEIMEPGVYLAVRTKARKADRHMGLVYGYYTDQLDENEEIFPYGRGAIFPDMEEASSWAESRTQGFELTYELGDEKVDVFFWNPMYLWEKQFVLPVEVDSSEKAPTVGWFRR